MQVDAPYELARRLEQEIKAALRSATYGSKPDRHAELSITQARRQANELRLDIRDYSLSESRAEQAKYALAARERLKVLRHAILEASSYGIFSSLEVAQLSARLDTIAEGLA